MRAIKTVSVALLLLLFSSLILAVNGVSAEEYAIAAETLEEITYVPGSDVALRSPPGVGYSWVIGDTQPATATCTWTIFDATYHLVYTEQKDADVAQFEDGRWGVSSQCIFSVPAFATEGTWVATPYFTIDGTVIGLQDPDQPFTVGPGTWVQNIFIAPLYVFGYKLPALFWCLSIVWIPLIIMGLLFVYARSAEGVALILADARDAGKRAREEWRKKKAAKGQ